MDINKCGRVAVVGRPNVGKSTLINAMVGEKVSIVSPKPQTTRRAALGVAEHNGAQLIFVDTPGLHKPRSRLGDSMVRSVYTGMSDVDAVVLVVFPDRPPGKAEVMLTERVKKDGVPAIAVVNKADAVAKESLLPVISAYNELHGFTDIIPLSAREGDGVELLLDRLAVIMPDGERIFPEDQYTDTPVKALAAEIIREKMLVLLDEEIPHGIAVEIERFTEREDGVTEISAVITCEKQGHKAIIIGKKGQMLKRAGTYAREDIEKLLGARVFLETWVRVRDDWRNNDLLLRDFGYER